MMIEKTNNEFLQMTHRNPELFDIVEWKIQYLSSRTSRGVKYYQPKSIQYDETSSEKMKIGPENTSSLKNIRTSSELSTKQLSCSTADGETYRKTVVRHNMVQENKTIDDIQYIFIPVEF